MRGVSVSELTSFSFGTTAYPSFLIESVRPLSPPPSPNRGPKYAGMADGRDRRLRWEGLYKDACALTSSFLGSWSW